MNILKKFFKEHFEEMIYIQHPRDSVIENVEKMINMFPELLHSENVLLDIPKDKKIKNLVYMIEVAYPATWTVEYLTKAKSGTNTNSDERKD